MSRPAKRPPAMHQQLLWGSGGHVSEQAARHARKYGLVFLRMEWTPGLWEAVEVAVFRTADHREVRRTAEMLAQAVQMREAP